MLKTDFIHSIKALCKSSRDPEKFEQLIQVLNQKNILDTPLDYKKVHEIIYRMYWHWEDVRTNPNNTQLKEVGNRYLNLHRNTPKRHI